MLNIRVEDGRFSFDIGGNAPGAHKLAELVLQALWQEPNLTTEQRNDIRGLAERLRSGDFTDTELTLVKEVVGG